MSYATTLAIRCVYAATIAIRYVYAAALTEISPDMANYILNRHDLTGLTGGTSVKLDGLVVATLALLQNGARLQLGMTGGIGVQYRLSDLGADSEVGAAAGGFIIICDNDTDRCWRLESVTKEGQPCAWNADSSKWHRVWGVGADGSAGPSLDASGFSLIA